MGSRVMRRVVGWTRTCAFLSVTVLLLLTWSAAQSNQNSNKTQSSGNQTAKNTSPDASKPAASTAGQESNHGLVEGAQSEIKRLQDYVNPPPPAKDMGNPDVKVWADLHTALYFCPGSKQYGHTSKGKYMSQKDAQDSNFESALRVPCPSQPVAAAHAKPAKKKPVKRPKTASKKTPATTASKQQN